MNSLLLLPFEWDLKNVDGNVLAAQEHGRLARRFANLPCSRLDLYNELWQHLYPLPHELRQRILTEIAAWMAGNTTARDSHRVMTHKELCLFAQSSLVEIGGHTSTHPSLSAHPTSVQREEIQENKRERETILERPVKTFSYPHGDYTSETVQLLLRAGFSCACTTEEQPVWRGSHCFQLPRCAVENWDGDEFANRLPRWLK